MKMTEKTSKISVIIPIFNTGKLISRCLESLVNQTYNNLEIICVNDCSTDNSAELIREFVEKDDRIKLINNASNLGLYHNRLEGLKHATGEYIAFLDSDDYVSLDYYRCLMQKAVDTNADLVFSKIVHENASDGRRYVHNLYHFIDFNNTDNGKTPFERYFEQCGYCFVWHTVWNKLYKKSLWDQALPYLLEQKDHMIMTEDFAFSSVIFKFAKSIASVDYSYHFYYQHAGASTSLNSNYKKFEKNVSDLVNAFSFVEKFLIKTQTEQKILGYFTEWKKLYSRFWYDNITNSQLSGVQKKYLLGILKKGFSFKTLSPSRKSDHYFYSVTTDWDSRYYELQNYLSKGQCSYYSFDIFDTIILRPFTIPSDLFHLLEPTYHDLVKATNSFYEIRKNAEALLRQKSDSEEVTLDEIYDFISEQYLLDKDVLSKIKQKEIEIELSKCYVRKSVKNLYDMLTYLSKDVIFVSDIYLETDVVKQILDKNGIREYKKLYLSSEVKKTKAFGSLYKFVVDELGVSANEIYHIGDSWQSDFENAQKEGLRAFFYARTMEIFKNSISDIKNTEVYNNCFKPSNSWINISKSIEFFAVRCAMAICANKLCDNPFEVFNQSSNFNCNSQTVGFFPVGMFLLGVTQWIYKEKEDGGEMHFIGRDGFLFKKAYELLYGEEANYVELSRKALIPLSISQPSDIMSLGKYVFWNKVTPSLVISLLSPILIEKNCESLKSERPFADGNEFNRFLHKLISICYDQKKVTDYRDKMREHFKNIFKEGEFLFDVGYSGRTQVLLSNLLGYPLNGMFIHINNDENLYLQKKLGIRIKTFYNFTPSVTGSQREYIFSKQAGSLIKFELQDNKIVPVFEDYKADYPDKYCISEIQNNSLLFIKEFKRFFYNEDECFIYRNTDMAVIFEQFVHNSINDLSIFNACKFEDVLWDGRECVTLSEIWRRDIAYHFLSTVKVTKISDYESLNPDDAIIRGFYKKSRWKKALCYFIIDKKLFWRKVKNHFKSKKKK